MRAAALLAWAAQLLAAQEAGLPTLAEALQQQGPQAVLCKLPAERSRGEILELLRSEPVEFTTRVRQRLQGLTQDWHARADIFAEGYRELLRRMEERRIDKQAGAGSMISGGSAPRTLGLAVESGEAEESGAGALTTVRGNLLGVAKLLFGAEQFPYCAPASSPCGHWSDPLRGLTLHVSLDASRPDGAKPLRMNSWGARWEFVNRRDPRDPSFRAAWREAVQSEELRASRESFAAARETLMGFTARESYRDLLDQLAGELQKLEAGSAARAAELIEVYIDRAAAIARSEPGYQHRIEAAQAAHARFVDLRDKLASRALARMSYAVEFNAFHPLSGGPYSDVRFVISGSPMKNDKVLLTGNAGASWWRRAGAEVKSAALRDIQAAVQLDRAAGRLSESVDMIWSLAASYRCVKEARAAALEAKLTLSVRGAPLKIPFAVTWTGGEGRPGTREARARVGVTLDWDAVLGNLGK